jgi:hypothetical protein
MSDFDKINQLVETLQGNITVLSYAQNIATAIVNGPANHCAATLSALLVFVEIYPYGAFNGTGDLQPWVPTLAYDLENRRGWTRYAVGTVIAPGDVGVVILASGVHHIYLVIDTSDQAEPLIADNQDPGLHPRAVVGDPAHSQSPTSYFLRAPSS